MIGVQIIAIIFVLWMTYLSFFHFRRREFTFWEFTFWQVIWLGFAFVVFFPGTLNIIFETLHFSRAFDFLTVAAILILFGATFRNYIIVKRTEKMVQTLTRNLALKE